MNEHRAKAWATRRQKYGHRGHAGAYSRGTVLDTKPLARLVAFVWGAGILSESQIAKVVERDIIGVRELRDEGRADLEVHPPKGVWAAHAMKRMEW